MLQNEEFEGKRKGGAYETTLDCKETSNYVNYILTTQVNLRTCFGVLGNIL